MGELGRILEDTPAGARRGVDLRFDVKVPRGALGAEEAFLAHVPLELPPADDPEGAAVRRAVSAFDDGDIVPLRLPAGFPDGGVLKLRRQGGVLEDGTPGDLLLRIRLVDSPPDLRGARGAGPQRGRRAVLGLALLLLLAVLGLGLWTSVGS